MDRKNLSYKKYDSSKFFANKIADGCQSITTPYAVLCADDDFLIPAGILESRNFLQENQDYASAHGLYFNHTNVEDAQKNGFSIGPLYQGGSSSEQDSAEKRLNAYMSGKTSYYPMYAVHRTDLFQQIWKETEIYVSDWGLSELFTSALSFIYGKMKVLPVFYSSREPNTYIWFDENRRREMYTQKKVKSATEGLGKHLCVVESMDSEDGLGAGANALKIYLDYREKKIINRRNWKDLTWSRLHIGLRARLQKLFLNGCHPSIHSDFKSDYTNLMQSVIKSNIQAEKMNSSRRQFAAQTS